jgi:hypothetical protein
MKKIRTIVAPVSNEQFRNMVMIFIFVGSELGAAVGTSATVTLDI